ncbi:TIGR02680 family protein [Streptomyces sp. Tu10]|uniref:TIGR02680 family protein n=1 Tax=Streptomyces sp. Tu10 TaxID=2838018 RepID=UPI001BDD544C|nr:TIGR02680 family protein [Streptomyces sp. Tu10]MBT1105651.1 TIGR02680 family protein [Streptomyces sp. Tu10]
MVAVTQLPLTNSHQTQPQPHSPPGRWRPQRAGILNIWRYYDETFTFHNGRLLLRGQNGTGKSKALELLLPFLFDANLRPNRLSTFGGSERTMHWNLMGEGTQGKTRVGYVWMEFAKPHPYTGELKWFTCGARLQASVHTSTVHPDYFTTSQRIDPHTGLSLVNESGQPLTRQALTDALHGQGEMHASAADYRTTVRQTLFDGMTEQRYEALITALLQLRQPKLSERLDPSLLSALLSRALPPLGHGEITELAEGFERLDRQREQLKQLDEEVTAATQIATQQRGYTQRVLRAAAATLISATTDMDNYTRTARESADNLHQATTGHTEGTERLNELRQREQELEGAIEGLIDSDDYKKGKELDRLRRRTEEAQATARTSRQNATTKQNTAATDTRQAASAADQADQHADHVRAVLDDTQQAARRTGMESVCLEAQTAFTTPADPATAPDRIRRIRSLLRGATTARRDQINQVDSAINTHQHAVRDRTRAESDLDGARSRLSEAISRRDQAADAYTDALQHHTSLLLEWATDCRELRITDLDNLASRAASESDILALVEPALRTADQDITTRDTQARAQRDNALADRTDLTDRIEQLRQEADLPPPIPATRTTNRTTLPGAPLWQLIAFTEDTPTTVQAGVEAALQAAGLLDAWITPHGELNLPGHDTLAEATFTHPAHGSSLLHVLRPEPDIPVPEQRVTQLLAGIAYGTRLPTDHPAAIGADGSWRLAAATGTWNKPEPAHIGALARHRARQRHIAHLTERLTQVHTVIAVLDTDIRALADRRTCLDADLAARPPRTALETTLRAWDRAEEGLGARNDAVHAAASHLEDREADVTHAMRTLSTLSAQHSLPTDRQLLTDLTTALNTFQETASLWADALMTFTSAQDRSTTAQAQAERSREAAHEQEEQAAQAEAEALSLAATLQAVESTAGEDFRHVATRISALRTERNTCRNHVTTTDTQLRSLERRMATLEATVAQDTKDRDEAALVRDRAAHRLRHLCLTGLTDDAGLTLQLTAHDGARATLEAARTTAARWPNLPHEPRHLGDALNRLSEAIHEARQHLGRRADLDLQADDDAHIFTASMDGLRVGATGLLDTLTAERDSSRQDITTAERSLFDQTLTGDTRRHLAARIRQANELVDKMNGHLERVRTASNVAVRLVWQIHPDLPPGTKAARELLLKDPDRITDEDREALHTFFRGRIEEAKAKNIAATWEEQLSEVLDYTAWHQFVVKLDRTGGTDWQLLTKKLHGALSGGEKAIALHLPLFAAVAAHHEAVPHAPRLILLDEVFVGVDTTNRGQVFTLLSALDLDLMLTSDHEWCTYRELTGIAIHQLITGSDGDDAVTSARFVWNGTRIHPDDTPETST